jgi:predicted RNase H-like HicB family nuclease
MGMLNNQLFFKLPVIITKQNRRFVAYTPALDISTSGKTEKEVKNNFIELVNLFFEEIIQAKTVDDILSELGWKKVQKTWKPPQVISSPYINMKIPSFA